MTILITGGLGYIGSHTAVRLLERGFNVVIADDLSNSKENVIHVIRRISGSNIPFYKLNIANEQMLEKVFINECIDEVIHFAGFKAVSESSSVPLKYYDNNLTSTITLLNMMQKYNVKKLVFSSSATVYTGALPMPPVPPITEDFTLKPTNPYGATKLMIEQILRDVYMADNMWAITILRYFNPIGAHESGLLGEYPNGNPNNLMPYITQVASGILDKVNIFGDDYSTKDGTGVRDYIHVMDLADGHVSALINLKSGLKVYNLGTGKGYSVLDIINTFVLVNNVQVPYSIAPRRPGDVDMYFADPSKAERELGWKAKHSLEEMCSSSWAWQKALNRLRDSKD